MTDEIVDIGGKLFVKAIAELIDIEISNPSADTIFAIGSQGWAQIPDGKKGMDLAQVTGAASSYARKYCLNALFAIDDTKDSDALPPDEPKHEETKGTENWRLIDGNVVLVKGQDGKFYELTRLTKRQLEVALKNPLYEGIKPFIEVELQKK